MSAGNITGMAYAGEIPWHKIGHRFPEPVTSDQMIDAAGMGFDVELRSIYVAAPVPEDVPPVDVPLVNPRPVASHVATVRTDTDRALGIVSPSYEPFQFREAFAFLDSLVQDGIAVYEAAGVFDHGARGWAVLRVGEDQLIAGDTFRRFVLVYTGHDGSSAVHVSPVNTRPICANTISAALGELPHDHPLKFSIRHTSGMRDRVADARRALEITNRASERLAQFLEAAAETKIEREDYRAIIDGVFGPALDPEKSTARQRTNRDRKIATLNRIAAEEVATYGATAYSAFNAITGYADHGATFRGRTPSARSARRFESLMFNGGGEALKARGIAVIRDRLPELARVGRGA